MSTIQYDEKTQKFINSAKLVHGDKYNYDKSTYTNATTKVTISCPHHGDFQQSVKNHLIGLGCPKDAYVKLANQPESITN